MQVVMVEFAVGTDKLDACVEALKGITGTLLATQPQFHGATVHVEHATGTVLNYMLRDTHQD